MPPLSMWLHVAQPGGRDVRMWLPLFILWIVLLPLLVLAFVITIVIDVVLFVSGRTYHYYTFLLLGACGLLADTRGMVVNIKAEGSIVDLRIQ